MPWGPRGRTYPLSSFSGYIHRLGDSGHCWRASHSPALFGDSGAPRYRPRFFAIEDPNYSLRVSSSCIDLLITLGGLLQPDSDSALEGSWDWKGCNPLEPTRYNEGSQRPGGSVPATVKTPTSKFGPAQKARGLYSSVPSSSGLHSGTAWKLRS